MRRQAEFINYVDHSRPGRTTNWRIMYIFYIFACHTCRDPTTSSRNCAATNTKDLNTLASLDLRILATVRALTCICHLADFPNHHLIRDASDVVTPTCRKVGIIARSARLVFGGAWHIQPVLALAGRRICARATRLAAITRRL